MSPRPRDRISARPVFVLVPGASHGAWCWQRVVGALDALGYQSIPIDLPCDDDSAGVDDYAEVVLDAITGVDDDVVLVGHSLGGLTIPVVAARRKVHKLVFVAGVMPVPGLSIMQQREKEDIILANPAGPGAGLRERYYTEARERDAAWAIAQLKPQAQRPYDEITPLTEWPNIESVCIVPTEDRTVNPDWSRAAARTRFGVEPVEMVGADHSPFLTRPAELARLLIANSI